MEPEQLTGRVVQYRFLLHGWQTGVIRGASSAAGRASTRGASRSFDIEFDDATKLTGKDAVPLYASEYGKDNRWVLLGGDALPAPPDGFRLVETDAAPKEVDADFLKKLVGDNTKEDADNLIMFNWGGAVRLARLALRRLYQAQQGRRQGEGEGRGEDAAGERSRADYQPGGGRSCRGTGGGSAPC